MSSPAKKSFALRIDPLLWADVERLAAQELRSVNAQVEYLLREALARRGVASAKANAPARGRPRLSDPPSDADSAPERPTRA